MLKEVEFFITGSIELNLLFISVLSFGEAIIIPIPPDVLIIVYSILDPKNWFIYSTFATVFSLIGGIAGYFIGEYFSKKVERIVKKENVEKVRGFYNKYGNYAIFLAGFSPIPYKVFTLSSGILKYDLRSFILYSMLSRALRFYVVGYLSSILGEVVLEKIKDPFYSLLTIIIAVVLVFLIEQIRRYLKRKKENREYGQG